MNEQDQIDYLEHMRHEAEDQAAKRGRERDALAARVKELESALDKRQAETVELFTEHRKRGELLFQTTEERDTLKSELTTLNEAYGKVATQVNEWRKVAYNTQQELEDAQATIKDLEAECITRAGLANWHSQQTAALTSAQQAERMEYTIYTYLNADSFTSYQQNVADEGWIVCGITYNPKGVLEVMWQRPVANEQGSEESETVAKAIQMLQDGGCTDGGHHKQWYIDQTLRLLMEQEAYEKWRMPFQIEYGWDEGVAP